MVVVGLTVAYMHASICHSLQVHSQLMFCQRSSRRQIVAHMERGNIGANLSVINKRPHSPSSSHDPWQLSLSGLVLSLSSSLLAGSSSNHHREQFSRLSIPVSLHNSQRCEKESRPWYVEAWKLGPTAKHTQILDHEGGDQSEIRKRPITHTLQPDSVRGSARTAPPWFPRLRPLYYNV